MKIAVTGALGQLGSELCRQIGPQAVPLDIDNLDLTDGKAVISKLLPMGLDLIINCAAYTQVDKAEKEPDAAHAVNATAVAYLVQVCREMDCPLVQISTDYVFGGNDKDATEASDERRDGEENIKRHSFREDDPPSPKCVYAKTKLAGEHIAEQYKKHLIVRTCGLYAHPSDERAHNFVKTIINLSQTKDKIRVVNDQYCTPSYVPHVAKAIRFIAGLSNTQPAPWGIYNITNTGFTTWFDMAVDIAKLAQSNVEVEAITTAEYGAPAARPPYSVLDTNRYHSLGGPAMPDWKTALEEYFAEKKIVN